MRGLHSKNTVKVPKNPIYIPHIFPNFCASLHHQKSLSKLLPLSLPDIFPLLSICKYLQVVLSDLPHLHPHLFHPSTKQREISLDSSYFKDQRRGTANINSKRGFLGGGGMNWVLFFFSCSILTKEK